MFESIWKKAKKKQEGILKIIAFYASGVIGGLLVDLWFRFEDKRLKDSGCRILDDSDFARQPEHPILEPEPFMRWNLNDTVFMEKDDRNAIRSKGATIKELEKMSSVNNSSGLNEEYELEDDDDLFEPESNVRWTLDGVEF